MIRAVGESRRRRLVAVGTGTGTVVLLAVVAVGGLSAREAPRAEVAAHTGQAQTPSPSESGTGDPDEVAEAMPYFQSKDPEKKIVGHVKDVRRSGTFIRVYTDLGESDENSEPAVSLCEWTTQFLKDGGEKEPIVFVHGKSSDNGSVVLANKQNGKDDCKVEETR